MEQIILEQNASISYMNIYISLTSRIVMGKTFVSEVHRHPKLQQEKVICDRRYTLDSNNNSETIMLPFESFRQS